MSRLPNGFGLSKAPKKWGTFGSWVDSGKFKGTRAKVRDMKLRIKEHRKADPFMPEPRNHVTGSPTSRFIHKPWPFKKAV